MPLLPVVRFLDSNAWVEEQQNLGECTCKSIPLLITVARRPDALVLPARFALSGSRRMGGMEIKFR